MTIDLADKDEDITDTEVAGEDALQDAELGLIDWLAFIAVQNFPQIALLAVIYLSSLAAFLCKDIANISNLELQQIELFFVFVFIRGRLIGAAVYDIIPLAFE